MASPENADEDDDDFFKEVYGREYSGPLTGRDSTRGVSDSQEVAPSVKARESSEEREVRDPNELPTDFTTREAKLWDAKAKAMERNWKRRREEELICRICGEVGHFAQGCPTTLGGGGGRPGEHVHRMPIRDRRLKPRLIGTAGSVIQGIEKSSGCRVKLEDNLAAGDGSFTVHITGPNEEKVKKAQDAVNVIIKQVEDEWQKQSQRKGVVGSSARVVTEHRAPPVSIPSGRPAPSRLHADVGRGEAYHSPPLVTTSGPRPLPAGPVVGTHYMDSDYLVAEQIAAQLELRRKWESAPGGGGLGILSTPQAVPYASNANYNEYDDVRVAGAYSNSAVPNELPQPSSQYYSQETRGSAGNYGEPVSVLPLGDSSVPSSSAQTAASVPPLGSGSLYGSQVGEATDVTAEEDMDVGYDDSGSTDKSTVVQSLEKLEAQFLEQTMALTRAQTAEEKAEQTRHAQCMADIGELYQKRMSTLRAEQTSRRHAFLHRHTKKSQPHAPPFMQGEQLGYSSYPPPSYPSYVHGSGGSTISSGPSTAPQNLGSEYGSDSGLPYPSRPADSISRPWVGVSDGSSAEAGISTRTLYPMPQQGDGSLSVFDNGVYSSARPPPLQNLSGVSFDLTLDGAKLQSTESLKVQPHSQNQSSYSLPVGYEVLQQGNYGQGQSYGHTGSITYTPNQQQY